MLLRRCDNEIFNGYKTYKVQQKRLYFTGLIVHNTLFTYVWLLWFILNDSVPV